ncbi:hypothetical protein MMC17_000281 [Xylographa soralifera]|nr:hypothetical protein [Xylographa soralifera]
MMESVRVPQTADDLLHNAVPDDEMPTWDDTMRAIAAHIESKSKTKYGEEKTALFPTAQQIAEIKAFLETVPLTKEATTFLPRNLKVKGKGEGVGEKDGKSGPGAQWRFGTRDKYRLDEAGIVWATGLKGGYVVPREQIHNVLVWAHGQTQHGGRDRMYNLIKEHYCESSFPKAFVGEWPVTCGHQKCQKKPRGVRNGMTPPAATRVTAQRQIVAHQRVNIRHAAAPAPAPAPVPVVDLLARPASSLRQAMPDPETISGWDDVDDWNRVLDAAANGRELPEEFQGLFTPAELVGYLPAPEPVKAAEVPPTAANEGVDLVFDIGEYLDFSAEDPELGTGFDS